MPYCVARRLPVTLFVRIAGVEHDLAYEQGREIECKVGVWQLDHMSA